MSVSTCILESDWMSKIVPCLLTVIMLMGTYIWWLLKERKELGARDTERERPGVRNPERNGRQMPKEKDEVKGTERSAKVPDLLIITESGECFHKPTCSYVKTKAKGKAKSRNKKLRPCTICFPMERKASTDAKAQNVQDSGNLTETSTA